MTDKEKAIVMAHTGICMLAGNKFQIFHKYVEDIMNRPIMTHELGWLRDEIKEKSKADFMALCTNESSLENPNKWIPVSERLPKESDGIVLITVSGEVKTGQYSEFSNTWYKGDMCGVGGDDPIAWMPLPKLYEPQESEDKE